MSICLVGLGSNVGDRVASLDRAVALLAAECGIRVDTISSYHTTHPAGGPAGQSDFLNAVVRCETSLSPEEFLRSVHHVEDQLGRTREVRWGERKIDIDVLLYDELVLSTPTLCLPHPRMAFRRFVLAPAAEVGANMVHAPTQWTVRELYKRLDEASDYLAVTGGRYGFRSTVAQRAAASLGCQLVTDPCAVVMESLLDSGAAGSLLAHAALAGARESALDVVRNPQASGEDFVVVSDFWIGESLALAAMMGDDEFRCDPQWPATQADVLKPKLLVVFHDESASSPGAVESPWAKYQSALRDLAARPRQCPILKLPMGDAQAAVDEITAAIQAMQ